MIERDQPLHLYPNAKCPFKESCVREKHIVIPDQYVWHDGLVVESLDIRPWHYGLNLDN
jgi:hypothetical protein